MTAPLTPDQQTTFQNSQAPLPTEAEVLRQQLAQQSQQIAQLTNVMGQFIQNQTPAQQAPQFSYNADELRDDPSKLVGVVHQMIRHEMQNSIAPLNEFKTSMQRQQQYAMLKQQVKGYHPNLTKFWHLIEPQLDNTFGTGQMDVNPQLVLYQAQSILGNLVLTQPNLLNQQSTPPSMITPSGAPAPSAPTTQLRNLTPNEEIIRQQRGWTVEQYLRESDPDVMIITPRAGK